MSVKVQLGHTATIALKFMSGDTEVPAPTLGGSVSTSFGGSFGNAVLAADQKTVTYTPHSLGQDTLTYNGPSGSGISATETIFVVATLADSAVFDESTFVEN